MRGSRAAAVLSHTRVRARARRCDEEEAEEKVKKDSAVGSSMGAKTLCLPLEQPPLPEGTLCFVTGKPAKNWALWGRSY
jgi:prolyl-tRNA synthetase